MNIWLSFSNGDMGGRVEFEGTDIHSTEFCPLVMPGSTYCRFKSHVHPWLISTVPKVVGAPVTVESCILCACQNPYLVNIYLT